MQVTSGAAQGSILGPDLWNATYDEILKIEMPHDTYLVGSADDIAAVIKAWSINEAESKLRQTMIRTKRWLDEHDSKLTYSKQIEYATTKAAKIPSQLSSLMANIGGPLPSRRKILMEASTSILLYGSEIWAPALKACAMERHKISIVKQQSGPQTEYARAAREETLEMWQLRWQNERSGKWTHKLVANVRSWYSKNHGEVNYYVTQMSTGHGYFRKNLHRMGKCSTPYCIYEEEVVDDAQHTFFKCNRWREQRQLLETEIGNVASGNIAIKMMETEANWKAVAKYAEYVLRTKKLDLDMNP
ncbi:uncharacterized protein [Musca autumnalis]|uniref:uncharacterized protein n=1 Tax=Musca autumnalis TaxID=221902 RepID=UPI003CEEBB8C